jgi:hypothetical protein
MVRWPVCPGIRTPSGICSKLFFHFMENIFRCSVLLVGHPTWWEDGSVIYLYNCYCTLPALSLLGEVLQDLWPYLTVSFETKIPLCCLLWHTGLWQRYTIPPPHRWTLSKVKIILWPMVSQLLASPSWCQAAIWDLWPIYLSRHWKLSLGTCGSAKPKSKSSYDRWLVSQSVLI